MRAGYIILKTTLKIGSGINRKENDMEGFSVIYRNYGHWDIVQRGPGRIFRIRGGPGKYRVIDEREECRGKERKIFKTVQACMGYIADELMFELIIAAGQKPQIIESWNI